MAKNNPEMMGRRQVRLAITAACFFCSPVFASGCSQPDLGPDVYCGTYRGAAKTTFNHQPDGSFATPTVYSSLDDLTLTTDIEQRQKYSYRGNDVPSAKVDEENTNIQINKVYLVAVKPGEGDHDFHVIISNGPLGSGTIFLNAEVSGTPRNDPTNADFLRVRNEIAAIVPEVAANGQNGYIRITGTRPVMIQGSLLFDGEHDAGCGNCPGPSWAKPLTVWEIHPVFHMEPTSDNNFAAVANKAVAIKSATFVNINLASRRALKKRHVSHRHHFHHRA